jgi:hypothetical protein
MHKWTWEKIRKDPMYGRINGRSKIKDKTVLVRMINDEYKKDIQQRKKENKQRTTILPDEAIQKKEIVPWLSTRQLGRYGVLSRETHALTAGLLPEHKVERFFLSLYHALKPSAGEISSVMLCFEDDTSIAVFSLSQLTEKYVLQEAVIHKTNTRLSKSSQFTRLPKTVENLIILLRKIVPVYHKYKGRLTRDTSYLPLFKGHISSDDRRVLRQIMS